MAPNAPKIIAFGALKGGTGKTMMTFQLSTTLAFDNPRKRILLVDADPQCNLTNHLGVDNSDVNFPSICDVFENPDVRPEDVVLSGRGDCPPNSQLPNLDLISSSIKLFDTQDSVFSRSNREKLFTNWLVKNKEFFNGYDWIICDTNPSMSVINQNIFYIADSIVLVTDVSSSGKDGIDEFVRIWGRKRKDLLLEDNVRALVINNYDARMKLFKELHEYFAESEDYGHILMDPPIPTRADLKASEVGLIPFVLFPDTKDNKELKGTLRKLIKNLKKAEVF